MATNTFSAKYLPPIHSMRYNIEGTSQKLHRQMSEQHLIARRSFPAQEGPTVN